MDEGNRDRALAHGRRDTFDIAAPDIADSEYSGQTGFEKMGRPGERPARGGQVFLGQIRPGLDETFGIEGDAFNQPLGGRNGAGHDEDVADIVGFDFAGLTVAPEHLLEMVGSFEFRDFGVRF